MITGFNTDVDYDERVFHVQTEDKGRTNPVVESLVYCGGQIIASRQSSYGDLMETGHYSEDEVLRRMELQHQSMIREINNGKFDSRAPKPFGHGIVTNRSLDEVVLAFLAERVPEDDPIRVELIDELELVEGSRPSLRMKVLEELGQGPIQGATVTVKLISTHDHPRELFSSCTDADGYVEASFEIPELPGANGAILCEVESAGRRAEMRQLIKKSP